MTHDALGAHARDELGLSEQHGARPLQAALASAGTFAIGAALPILSILLTTEERMVPVVSAVSLISLAGLGALAAWAGGASTWKGAARVVFWGAVAMGITFAVGALFGTTVA